ncbi:MAG: DUF4037 domain-containing protein [Thermomicrobiales bacterium]|nr:DUF4037 domain-containing protein [Thermomicrobiales bacterium]
MTPYSHDLIAQLSKLPEVEAIAIGGSQASGRATPGSDVDLYVLTADAIPTNVRRGIANELADDPAEIEIANPYWGDEDGYAIDGVWHDIVFFDSGWFLDEIARATVRHEAREGYSTSFVFTLVNMQPIFDPMAIVTTAKAMLPEYPGALTTAIIARNFPVACGIHASYRNQIARAVALNDAVALNHRVAAFLACVFDIAFASLRMWHPGEKRQLQYLDARRDDLPAGFTGAIRRVVDSCTAQGMGDIMAAVDDVVAGLTEMVQTKPS